MKTKKQTAVIRSGVAALALSMAACGTGSPSSATGVVQMDGAVAGVVSLTDASSPTQKRQAPTGPGGAFSIDTTGLKPPYLLKAEGTTASARSASTPSRWATRTSTSTP